jgi:hypothetical protein
MKVIWMCSIGQEMVVSASIAEPVEAQPPRLERRIEEICRGIERRRDRRAVDDDDGFHRLHRRARQLDRLVEEPPPGERRRLIGE